MLPSAKYLADVGGQLLLRLVVGSVSESRATLVVFDGLLRLAERHASLCGNLAGGTASIDRLVVARTGVDRLIHTGFFAPAWAWL
jgi:hypothetical protein